MGAVFTGAATALVTPFTEDNVDEPLLKKLIDRQIGAGVDALVVLGTTGEPCTMTAEEREQTLRRAVEYTHGRVPVIAGVGSNDTRCAASNARMAREAGADALLVVTPYYNKCSQEGLIAHFERVAEAGGLPTILYNVPSRTGVNMLPETVEKLSQHPLIRGLKEASTDIVQLARDVWLTGKDFLIYGGNDEMCLPAIAVGAKGLISVTANVAPDMVIDMVHKALSGDGQGAMLLAKTLARLNRLMFQEVNPIPCKAALHMLGFGKGKVRLPLTSMTRKNARQLKEELLALGLLS